LDCSAIEKKKRGGGGEGEDGGSDIDDDGGDAEKRILCFSYHCAYIKQM